MQFMSVQDTNETVCEYGVLSKLHGCCSNQNMMATRNCVEMKRVCPCQTQMKTKNRTTALSRQFSYRDTIDRL